MSLMLVQATTITQFNPTQYILLHFSILQEEKVYTFITHSHLLTRIYSSLPQLLFPAYFDRPNSPFQGELCPIENNQSLSCRNVIFLLNP